MHADRISFLVGDILPKVLTGWGWVGGHLLVKMTNCESNSPTDISSKWKFGILTSDTL